MINDVKALESQPVPEGGWPMPPFGIAIRVRTEDGVIMTGALEWHGIECSFCDEFGLQWPWDLIRAWWPIEEPPQS